MAWSNIILFGESGGGKSSVVNTLSNDANAASTLGGARGFTSESRGYDADILGEPVTLWDTAGLDGGDAGRLPRADAICQLYRLLQSLSDGVNLLVFVMRGPRIKGSVSVNWKVF
ncbi:hypothetical protein NP233_g6813 [Leucocoprinus birnbaumii]|uniref:G domain-containing protein n=1 Tax=Leucocoprinus birnbaumii TaxID=56174 RepID=A0AAD5YQL1_9AGAR|nr:hypothetical protein NP233_g6813 [Leucocoprinus birnbaumii]